MSEAVPEGFKLRREGDGEPPPPGFVVRSDDSPLSLANKSVMPGLNKGLATMLGLPVDLVNQALEALGVPVSEEPLGGSKSIKGLMGKAGIGTEPTQETTKQKYAAAIGEGAGAGAVFGPAGALTGAVGNLAGEAVKQRGGGPVAQTAAALAGGIGAGGAANVALKTGRAIAGAPGSPTLQAMRAENIQPRMVGDVTESSVARSTTAGLLNAPLTGGIIQKAAKETTDEIATAVERRAASYGAGETPTMAGQAIEAGVQNYASRVSDIAEKMYARMHKYISPATPVATIETGATVAALRNTMEGMPKTSLALTPSLFRNVADDLAQNTNPSFGTLSRLRTEVGKRLGDPMLIDDIGRADLKALYKSLTGDLKHAAAQISPQALREFEKSNAFYREQMQFIEGAFQKFTKAGVTPENFFQWATAEGRIGATRLAGLKKAMGQDEFGIVSSTVLRRMGTGGKDVPFDTNVFVREWSKITPEAKRVLFGGRGWEGYAASVDRIVDIATQFRETGRLANTSRTAGTAQLLAWIGLIGAGGGAGGIQGAAGTIGGAIVTQAAVSKLLTSPAFATWLATPVGPNGIPMHIKLLGGVVQRDPEITEPAQEFLLAVGAQP